MNIDEFKKASCFGHEAAAAYIVLCGGVDSKKSDTARISTHGCLSVSKRVGITETRAERAINALLKQNLIRKHESKQIKRTHVPGEPTYYINDDHVSSDVAISQEFLHSSERMENSKDFSCSKQSLAYFCENALEGDDIPHANAVVDALTLFFALHQKQDFDLFAGVDPQAASATFRPINNGEGWDYSCHLMPMEGNTSWKFFSMIQEGDIQFSKDFLEQTFKGLPVWEGCPSDEKRGLHAIEQLKKASLVYNSIVLWKSNPLAGKSATPIDPIYTLYVASKRNDKNELMLQHSIHDAWLKSNTLVKEVAFPVSGNIRPKPVWTNSSIYTYVLDGHSKFGNEMLLSQFRVARWAADGKMNDLLKADRIRTEKWETKLKAAAVVSIQAALC
ncbi:hypothetical protein Pnap_4446 (plasmid) [Polaromonas naphthalenivorans CJ2]|uniref:Uncharacterized protein n=2 Tax=Polaromonas naphthalenivorans TaxID=216465 RepID=A1VVP5_POLNA|nr:hypothetical protein Pnap_4446 [Polaromonas naphthalenivorans CJ2]